MRPNQSFASGAQTPSTGVRDAAGRSFTQVLKSSEKPFSRSYTTQPSSHPPANDPSFVTASEEFKDPSETTVSSLFGQWEDCENHQEQSVSLTEKDADSSVERMVASYKTAVLSNRLQITALSEAIDRENQRLEATGDQLTRKTTLETEVGRKTAEVEGLKAQLRTIQEETEGLGIECEEAELRVTALRETKLKLNRQISELNEALKHLTLAQTTAEARLGELQLLHRHYEANQDQHIQELAKLHSSLKAEEDLTMQLTFELDRKKDQDCQLAEEIGELERLLENLENESSIGYQDRIKETEDSCERIRQEIRTVESQLGEATASIEIRGHLARQLQQESAQVQQRLQVLKQRQQSAVSLSSLFPQAILAFALGTAFSYLLAALGSAVAVA